MNDTASCETGGFDGGGNGGRGFQIMDDDAAVAVLGEDELADKGVGLRVALGLSNCATDCQSLGDVAGTIKRATPVACASASTAGSVSASLESARWQWVSVKVILNGGLQQI